MARSTARKRALNTLYEADEKSQSILSLLDERLEHPGAQTPLPEYAVTLVRGVAEHRRIIDRLLNEHSDKWPVKRMPVVDRNIMRIAVWEIVYNDEVPAGVAIDEALAQAKTLSDSDSPAFMHAVLSHVADQVETMTEEELEELYGGAKHTGYQQSHHVSDNASKQTDTAVSDAVDQSEGDSIDSLKLSDFATHEDAVVDQKVIAQKVTGEQVIDNSLDHQ